jgi:hypothetical protein
VNRTQLKSRILTLKVALRHYWLRLTRGATWACHSCQSAKDSGRSFCYGCYAFLGWNNPNKDELYRRHHA